MDSMNFIIASMLHLIKGVLDSISNHLPTFPNPVHCAKANIESNAIANQMNSDSPCWSRKKILQFENVRDLPVSRLRVILKDFTSLLGQHMYFWGRDVLYSEGNLLCEYGFERIKSKGLQGTSCYRKSLDSESGGKFIELHGACAGCYDFTKKEKQQFLYIRNKQRCFLYSSDCPPDPGFYLPDNLFSGPAIKLYIASLRFVDWWLNYEDWIAKSARPGWRNKNYRAFAKLPASKPSLPPADCVHWLRDYQSNPKQITRVREKMRAIKSA
jgi:hypothetical protein